LLTGYYGIGLISETASSQSGGVFFVVSMFFLYLIEKSERAIDKLKYAAFLFVSLTLTFATISRTAIMAAGVAVTLYALYILIRMRVSRLILMMYLTVLMLPVAYLIIQGTIDRILERLNQVSQGAETRLQHWKYFLSHSDQLGLLIVGNGKGYVQNITGGFTLAADSQYVRLLVEVGVVGTILWLATVFSLLLLCWQARMEHPAESLFVGLVTIGFLTMGVTHEVFVVTMQASVYWAFMGLFMGYIMNEMRHREYLIMNETTNAPASVSG